MIVVMGGTYDPVHVGHLRVALELSEHLNKGYLQHIGDVRSGHAIDSRAKVHLMPCYNPVHRELPGASSSQRVDMLMLSTQGEPDLVVDEREIQRGGPSYTVDTLRALRQQYGQDEPIVLVLGTDAFNGLARWHEWLEIPTLAHIIVLNRPGWVLAPCKELQPLLESNSVERIESLFECAAGYILPLELSLLEISSSKVRSSIAKGHSARYLVSDTVWHYIRDNQLYGYRD